MRNLNRGLRFSREQLIKENEKDKKRMNKIYQNILAREDAIKHLTPFTPEEAANAKAKEEKLKEQVVQEMEKLEQEPVPIGEVPPFVQNEEK